MKAKSKIVIGLISAGVLGFILLLSFSGTFFRSKQITSILIADNVQRLADIFEEINETCGIIDFDFKKNPINFLNVKEFVGSEVGPMNLAKPEHWKGPYVADNPTIYDKEFQVIYTKNGYFITPGDGVELPNGKIVGKDIIIDEHANIPAMMANENALLFEGKALAAPINMYEEPEVVVPEVKLD